METVMPVKIEGPTIQWLVNIPLYGVVVSLINNSPEIWHGEVIFKNRRTRIGSIKDLWTEEKLSTGSKGGQTHVKVNIEPFGFRVLG